jgi:hypothetical protein
MKKTWVSKSAGRLCPQTLRDRLSPLQCALRSEQPVGKSDWCILFAKWRDFSLIILDYSIRSYLSSAKLVCKINFNIILSTITQVAHKFPYLHNPANPHPASCISYLFIPFRVSEPVMLVVLSDTQRYIFNAKLHFRIWSSETVYCFPVWGYSLYFYSWIIQIFD